MAVANPLYVSCVYSTKLVCWEQVLFTPFFRGQNWVSNGAVKGSEHQRDCREPARQYAYEGLLVLMWSLQIG